MSDFCKDTLVFFRCRALDTLARFVVLIQYIPVSQQIRRRALQRGGPCRSQDVSATTGFGQVAPDP